jgi:hypothetical protein
MAKSSETLEKQELALLHEAVGKAEHKVGRKIIQSADVTNMTKIVEDFLKRRKLVCYGGTAINNILPKHEQFYDKDAEVPDFDFYSPHAMNDAKNLADIFAYNDYTEVEVRSSIHKGTFKVFINFIPFVDITQMDHKLYKILQNDALKVNGIYYSAPNHLRLHLYNELSRPDNDVSRWEKVYKRLLLLNKHYPLDKNPKCSQINFMRDFVGNPELNDSLYNLVKDTMIDEGLVFIGGFASSLYSRYMAADQKKQLRHVPDFDVLAEDPHAAAKVVKEQLEKNGFKKVRFYRKPAVDDEVILEHYQIMVDKDIICFIYKPKGCYSYNSIQINKKTVNIATIETMMLFLFAFIYSGRPYYDHDRILCMAEYLTTVMANNRLEQKGLLKRFNINCYGKELTIHEIRAQKTQKYKELKHDPDNPEYKELFFKYIPMRAKSMRIRKSMRAKSMRAKSMRIRKSMRAKSMYMSMPSATSMPSVPAYKNKTYKNKTYKNKKTRRRNFWNIF